jgi:hypothetical protein
MRVSCFWLYRFKLITTKGVMHLSLMQNENAMQKKACVEMLNGLPSAVPVAVAVCRDYDLQ